MSAAEPTRPPPSPELRAVFESVYGDIHRCAERLMVGERPGHTLEPAALVNEVFLKLVKSKALAVKDRGHFIDLCEQVMRNTLIDHARGKSRAKRPPPSKRVTLSEAIDAGGPTVVDAAILNDALERLKQADPLAESVAYRRLLLGRELREIAEDLGLTIDQVKYQWKFARAWLQKALAP